MDREFTVKSFKSGNSVALRLPKALGIVAGEDLVLVAHDDGEISFWRKADAKNVFMRLFGSMSAGFMADGRGDIDQDDYAWQGSGERPEAA